MTTLHRRRIILTTDFLFIEFSFCWATQLLQTPTTHHFSRFYNLFPQLMQGADTQLLFPGTHPFLLLKEEMCIRICQLVLFQIQEFTHKETNIICLRVLLMEMVEHKEPPWTQYPEKKIIMDKNYYLKPYPKTLKDSRKKLKQ